MVVGEGINFDSEFTNYKVLVTSKGLLVVDATNTPVRKYEGLNIVSALYVDECYLYCILGNSNAQIDYYEGQSLTAAQLEGVFPRKRQSGLYVLDVSKIVADGSLHIFQLKKFFAEMNPQLRYNLDVARIGFLNNLHEICIMPLPHRNTLRLLGSKSREHYLIWREKFDTFTAIRKSSRKYRDGDKVEKEKVVFFQQTWRKSLGTILSQNEISLHNKKTVAGEVTPDDGFVIFGTHYEADSCYKDTSYTKGFTSLENCSR